MRCNCHLLAFRDKGNTSGEDYGGDKPTTTFLHTVSLRQLKDKKKGIKQESLTMSRVHSDVPWVSCSPSRTRGRSAWGVGPPASVPARSALDRPREQSGWGRSWPSTWDRSGSRLPTVTRDKKSQSLTEPCRLQDDQQSLFWPVRIKDWLTSNLWICREKAIVWIIINQTYFTWDL